MVFGEEYRSLTTEQWCPKKLNEMVTYLRKDNTSML
jgi:hypothetical protein